MRDGGAERQQTDMDCRDKVIKLGNLIQGNVYYDLRHAIYWPKGCAPALTAAMGMGGGDSYRF